MDDVADDPSDVAYEDEEDVRLPYITLSVN